jgi:pilus biogenesis lipoprotein CpaD
MEASRFKSLNAVLPMAMVLALLGGCAEHLQEEHQTNNPIVGGYRHVFHHAKWKQGKEPFENYVEPITLSHDVLFQPGQATITATGRQELHAFLRSESVGSDELVVLNGPANEGATPSPLTTARLAALKTELERSGLTVAMARPGDTDGLMQPNQVAVSVTRMTVLSPDCEVPPPEPGKRPDYRWSCSSTVNLGAMVANPEDLAHGRDFEPSDGEALARGVEAYRMGDKSAEKIVVETTGNQ